MFLQLKDGLSLLEPIKNVLTGGYYNLWFMFMLFGLYLLTPVIIRIKKSISNKSYCIVSVILMVFAVVSQSTTIYGVSYSYGTIISYMAYFIIGSVVYENLKKGKKYAVIFSCLSLITFVCAFLFRYVTKYEAYALDPNRSFFSPFIVIGSIFLFIAFSNISIGHRYKKLPEKTYYIYMFHTVCYLTIFSVMGKRMIVNEIVTILIITCVTLIVSWIASTVYLCIWNALEKKFGWKEKWNKIFS